jgi:hypothetical protein
VEQRIGAALGGVPHGIEVLAGARDVAATKVQGGQGRQRGQLLLDEVDSPGTRQSVVQAFVGAVQIAEGKSRFALKACSTNEVAFQLHAVGEDHLKKFHPLPRGVIGSKRWHARGLTSTMRDSWCSRRSHQTSTGLPT